ncbi:glycosyltransferase [Patescibacteria group bacterium]
MRIGRFDGKKILIIHFRVGRTDGVSIEIASWKKILEGLGAEVKLCSGSVNSGADFVIDDLEQQLNVKIFDLDENSFGGFKTYNEETFTKTLLEEQLVLEEGFSMVFESYKPDQLIVSNIFSVGENLPAAGALTKVLDKFQIPTLAVHHDFYWENQRYKKSSSYLVSEQLKKYFPPKRRWIKHCCINTIAQDELWRRKGIRGDVLYDTQDFTKPSWKKNNLNHRLIEKFKIDENDILVLQATRIVRRKNIEIAISFVDALTKKLNSLSRKITLYDNRRFVPKKQQAALIIAGYAEERDKKYLEQLKKYATDKKVKVYFIGDSIKTQSKGNGAKFSLWDIYPYADLITYPSEHEGFGNQFLEATFAKKPVVIFEYPVFVKDIKPKGFEVVSFGRKVSYKSDSGMAMIPQEVLQGAVEQSLEVLTNSRKHYKLVNNNFIIGRLNFSHENTCKKFMSLLDF